MVADHVAGPWSLWITASHQRLVGEKLCVPSELYMLPAVVLCHDTAVDPLFVYANAAAQKLWERSWEQFIGWPSRLTAPPQARAQRAAALAEDGVVRGYSGVRVAASGRLFRMRSPSPRRWAEAGWPTVRMGAGRHGTSCRVTRSSGIGSISCARARRG